VATVPDAVLARLTTAATRVTAGLGLELFDLQFRREPVGWVLRVVIDRPGRPEGPTGPEGPEGPKGPTSQEEPVGINDCRRVSEDLSALLDVEDDLTAGIDQAYTLEVSSPGLDRPLRGEADYRRFTGRLAKIVTREPVQGQSHFTGRLAGVEGGEVLLTEGRRVHRVPLAAIRRARLDVEF
jgi:ribosome maturation factor RimP